MPHFTFHSRSDHQCSHGDGMWYGSSGGCGFRPAKSSGLVQGLPSFSHAGKHQRPVAPKYSSLCQLSFAVEQCSFATRHFSALAHAGCSAMHLTCLVHASMRTYMCSWIRCRWGGFHRVHCFCRRFRLFRLATPAALLLGGPFQAFRVHPGST